MNYTANIFSISKKLVILATLSLLMFFAISLVANNKTHAFHPAGPLSMNPDPLGSIPGGLYNYLRNCPMENVNPHRTPAFAMWISDRYNPGNTAITVPYGTNRIDLTMHFAAAICYPTIAYQSNMYVLEVNPPDPHVVGLVQQEHILRYSNQERQDPNTYKHSGRNFYFEQSGGFRCPVGQQSCVVNVPIRARLAAINSLTDGQFLCVMPPPEINPVANTNYHLCPSGWVQFDITVYVVGGPPPNPTNIWELNQETANINGVANTNDNCATASVGDRISFGSTITNQEAGPVTSSNGNLADVRITKTPGSLSGTNLILRNGSESYNNVAIGGNQTYTLPQIEYEIPNGAQPGETFYVRANYLELQGPFVGNVNAPGDVRFFGTSGAGGLDGPGPQWARACVRIVDFAYLKVHGSGVWSGAVWDSLEQCLSTTHSLTSQRPIESYISDGVGSSAEYGVTSLKATIEGFASAIVRNTQINQNNGLDHLAFANTNNPPGTKLGNATAPAKCLPDLYENLYPQTPPNPRNPTSIRNNAPLAGEYVTPMLTRLSGNTIGNEFNPNNVGNRFAGKAVVLVNGNLTINGNIRYTDNYGTTSNLRIPSLVFLVKGNINIDPDVSRLDGLYMSIPDENGNGGNINTCHVFDDSPGHNQTCDDQKLTVNGAFISSDADFYRFIYGAQHARSFAGSPTGSASEVFEFSPELYISNPFAGLIDFNSLKNQKHDYYTERAPVY